MLRLLILLAMLITPLGMAPAAATQTVPSAMPMQHCPEQGPNHHSKTGFAECTMACSAALPAAERIAGAPLVVICVPVSAGVASPLHGIHPETATPPPRRS
jgi:hypothetical protein